MCNICAHLQTFSTQCNLSGDIVYANLRESGDIAGGSTTTGRMEAGDSFVGEVGYNGDVDWIAVRLEAGSTYRISLQGGSLDDPYLTLYDGSGNYVTYNDDSFGSLNSVLTHTATTTGTYFIAAEAYDYYDTGSYTLEVTQTATPDPVGFASWDDMAGYLTDGYWDQTGRSSGAFDTRVDNQITVNLNGLNGAGQQLARWAFEVWEAVADIQFVERGFGADIRFTDNQSGAYATTSVSGTTGSRPAISEATINVSDTWLDLFGTTIDSYSMSTYIHEIGHALGLGHQGNYNGNGSFATDAEFANDSRSLSVMSYFNPSENPNTNASDGEMLSLMMVDIIAIQSLYGAADGNSVTAGDTTWGGRTNMTGYWAHVDDALSGNRVSGVYDGEAVTLTIFDQGGIDMLDLSYSTGNDTINLRGGTFSDVNGLIGNVAIARGTVIENVTTGSGNDVVNGDWMTNVIITNAGNDTVNGENGWDRIWTGGGDDLVLAGNGNDRVGTEDGFDTIWAGTGDDTVWAGGWSDTIGGGDGSDLVYAGGGNDLVWGGSGDDTLDGAAHNDTLNGGSGADLVWGGDGNDTVNGGAGDDTLNGGSQNDLLSGGDGSDVITGGWGDDALFGGTGEDVLGGSVGNDRLWAGWGDDTISGGSGADVFIFGRRDGRDTVTDFNRSEGDILRLDDALWTGSYGTLNSAAVLSNFGVTQGNGITFTFDGGEVISLTGSAVLADALEIF